MHFTDKLGVRDGPPPCRSWWAQSFDDTYRQRCLGDRLYRFDIFVTVLMHPDAGFKGSLRSCSVPVTDAGCHSAVAQDFEDVVMLIAGLARYGVRRLSLRKRMASGSPRSPKPTADAQRALPADPLVAGRHGRLVTDRRYSVCAPELIGNRAAFRHHPELPHTRPAHSR